MDAEAPKVRVSFKDAAGLPVNIELSLDDAEALGLQLIAQAASRRPKDERPLHEQTAHMVIQQPPTEVFFEQEKQSVGLMFKLNHMRPVQVWYDLTRAKEVAYLILNLASGPGGAKN